MGWVAANAVKSFTRVSQMEKKTFAPGTGTNTMPRLFVQRFESGGKFVGCAWTRTHAAASTSKAAGRIHDLVANDDI